MTEHTEAARRATVRVVPADDPAATGQAIADEQGAEVASDLRTAERAVRDRVDAGRRALGDPAADDALVQRAEAIRTAAAVPPPIEPGQVAELERLARELDRAARIRQRTEARFSTAIQARLAVSTGVALHPEAIRTAATAVVVAEADISAADAAMAALGDRPPEPDPAPDEPAPDLEPHAEADAFLHHGDDPVLQRPHDVFDELALDKRRATFRALTAGGLLVIAGLVAAGLGQTALGIALTAVGLLTAAALFLRGHHTAEHEDAGRVRSAARLDGLVADLPPSMLSRPDPAPPAPPPGPDPALQQQRVEQWEEQRSLLVADRMDAAERLRVAEKRWSQLAGAGADPHDPEPVIRANDPQLASDPRVAEGSPTVRAVAAFHRTVQAKWRVLWASLGVDDPPEPDELDARLADVLGDTHHAVAELGHLEAAESRIAARSVVRRPLVLVEPSSWISEARLGQLLASVPADGTVVVVDRPGPAESAANGGAD